MERRLAAILAADVVGYSRLMERDEAGTLATLKSRRNEVLQPLIGKHHGRVVKVMGDGVLVEFASAVNAVICAIELQQAMEAANSGAAENGHIVLRIGVNVGDVVVEGGDLYGDGVNVASRIEGLAEPGGIYLSQTVFNQVRGKVRAAFEDLGEQNLKNLSEPVRIYRLVGAASKPTMEAPGRAPSKLSIAVLPFINLSGDPEQEYFADGLTEDVITELSRFKSLQVTARNSSFHYKGKAAKVTDIGRELNVYYVLEGSVRKAGERVRVTAQLIETTSGNHVWAERYDRGMADIFAVQDELIAAIASTLEGRMVAAGSAAAQRKPTQNWSAYDYFLRGRSLANAYREKEAAPFFAQSVLADPDFAQAHAWRSIALLVGCWFNSDQSFLTQARESAEKAVALDSSDANSHHAMGMVSLFNRQFQQAEIHFNRAVALNPLDVSIRGDRADLLCYAGRLDEALQAIDEAIRRDAFPPVWLWGVRGRILFHMSRHREAIEALRNLLDHPEDSLIYFIASLAKAGERQEANAELGRLRSTLPDCTIASISNNFPYADAVLLKQLQDGLRAAGVPE